MSYQPKIALVHDDFCQRGGAEALFAQIAQIYPNAPIYTSQFARQKLPTSIDKGRIQTSFMQKIPFAAKFYKLLLPLYPLAFESFDFSQFDVVISSSTRFSKGIITKPKTVHICYINSTPRFLWHESSKEHYIKGWTKIVLLPLIVWLKKWDQAAAQRVDYFISNSQNIALQVKKYYKRKSIVLYPFADTKFYYPPKNYNEDLKSKNYFLIVSRLVRWKKIDIAIKACTGLGKNLIIVGDGPDKNRLKNLVRNQQSTIDNQQSTISFLGSVSHEKLREFYQNANALITTQEEDFGIAAVEAQACGIPVIAYSEGGQKEIIIDQRTGLFFTKQTHKSLKDAILRLSRVKWDISACRKNSLRFSKDIFVRDFKKAIADITQIGRSDQ